MTRFRKKPVLIEAVQFNGIEMVDDCHEAMFDLSFLPPDWLVEAMAKSPNDPGAVEIGPDNLTLLITTLEGVHHAMPDDWIIRGIKGELYPCKPDIFAATYEPVDA